jgi:hypothetical protein
MASLAMYIYIYIYMCVCCIYIYVCVLQPKRLIGYYPMCMCVTDFETAPASVATPEDGSGQGDASAS